MPREGDRLHKVTKRDGKTYIGRRHMRLGRRREREDDRDYQFERPKRRRRVATTYKSWPDRTWRGDQGNTPQCVAYSALHVIENSPITYPSSGPVVAPKVIYDYAQANDEWPGADYDGTSVRAGAKAALSRGFISEYQRIDTIDDIVYAVQNLGPVIVGTDWTDDMFSPIWKKDAKGTYRWMLVPTGAVAGGHAWTLNADNIPGRVFRMLQSWGPFWGDDAHAWISFDDVEQLVFGQNGEAFRYVERAA